MSHLLFRTAGFAVLMLGLQTGIGTADTLSASLLGYNVVPSVFTAGSGKFTGTTTATTINYTITYKNLAGAVQQAHIHFGQPGTVGAIIAFLCTNLGNGPAGTPPCPAPPATVTGTVTAARIVGIAASQGIGAGQISRVIKVINDNAAYVSVHSTMWPGGEIRAPIATVP